MNYAIRDANGRFTKFAADIIVEMLKEGAVKGRFIIADDERLLYPTYTAINGENGNSGWKLAKERDKKSISMRKRDLPKLRKSKTTGAIVLLAGIETGVELTNYLSNDDYRCRESYVPRDTDAKWQPLTVKEAIKALKGQK